MVDGEATSVSPSTVTLFGADVFSLTVKSKLPRNTILMIVFSNFPQTRPVAVFLSSDGRLRH